MAEDKVRRGLLIKTALEILRDAGTKVPQARCWRNCSAECG